MDENERIITLLVKLEGYYNDIKKYLPVSYTQYAADIEKRGFMERRLQLCIEVCIDVCQLLVKDLKLGLPEKEESIFGKLAEKEVITAALANKLKNMKRFRNVLIHHYVDLDDALIYKHAKSDGEDFIQFKKEILAFFKKK